jgi:hypothetical protein
MMFGTAKLKVVAGAESAMKAWSKAKMALQNEVSTLQGLISARVEADRALIAAETAVAIGEQADVPAARQRADNALAAVDRKAAVLQGLRSRLAGQAADLESNVQGIKAALPEYVVGLKADFKEEWTRGIATFAVLLGKRRALEAVIGKIELAEPQAAACELRDDLVAPQRAIKELTGALEQLAGWSRGAAWPDVDAAMSASAGGRLKHFDPRAVYCLTRECEELPVGALVMEASLAPGFLRHLVQIEYAVPLASQEWQAEVEAGRRAADRLSYEEQQARVHEGETPVSAYERVERKPDVETGNENLYVRPATGVTTSHGGTVTI